MKLCTAVWFILFYKFITFGTQVEGSDGDCHCGFFEPGVAHRDDIGINVNETVLKNSERYPFLVAILPVGGEGGGTICSGVIISPTALLASAHCGDLETRKFKISLFSQGSQPKQARERAISRIIKYPNLNNDIAIWFLKTSIGDCKSDAIPICLPDRHMGFQGQYVYTAGIGKNRKLLQGKDKLFNPEKLRDTTGILVSTDLCDNPLEEDDSIFCVQGNDPDTCAGNPGTVMFLGHKNLAYLLGVISAGHVDGKVGVEISELCKPGIPEAFVSVYYFRKFIQEHVKDLPTPRV